MTYVSTSIQKGIHGTLKCPYLTQHPIRYRNNPTHQNHTNPTLINSTKRNPNEDPTSTSDVYIISSISPFLTILPFPLKNFLSGILYM